MKRRRIRGNAASWHARAPTRIDFGGGWTDVPIYASQLGGAVVNAAVKLFMHVDVLRGARGIFLCAEDLSTRVRYDSPGEIRYDGQLDLHKAALNILPVTGGIEILSHTELPSGAGLGASGALDVALCAALARARGEWYDPVELAELGFHLEAVELQLLGGRQDQYAAALGGFLQLGFGDQAVEVKPLAVTPEMAADLRRHAVLAHTGESHFSSATHHRVWQAFEAQEATVADALAAMYQVGRALGGRLETADWRGLAALVDENWRHQQRLDDTIVTPRAQRIERAARAAGAWGLKATGAGAGGCLLALGPAGRRDAMAAAMTAAGATILDFEFDFDGVTTREVTDAGGDPG